MRPRFFTVRPLVATISEERARLSRELENGDPGRSRRETTEDWRDGAFVLYARKCRPAISPTVPWPADASGPDSKSCTKIGEATLPNRQRNRPAEGDRKNDPISLRCTPVHGCLKNAEIVRQNPALWRARNAFQAAKPEPHIISSQADPIRRVYIRANGKHPSDYPPPFVGRQFQAHVHLSPEETLSAFLYPSRARRPAWAPG